MRGDPAATVQRAENPCGDGGGGPAWAVTVQAWRAIGHHDLLVARGTEAPCVVPRPGSAPASPGLSVPCLAEAKRPREGQDLPGEARRSRRTVSSPAQPCPAVQQWRRAQAGEDSGPRWRPQAEPAVPREAPEPCFPIRTPSAHRAPPWAETHPALWGHWCPFNIISCHQGLSM